MNKFKTKNNRFIKLFYILIILFILLIIFFKNLDINYILLKSVKSKFDNNIINTNNINIKLVYNSLNKIVDYKDMVNIQKNEVIDTNNKNDNTTIEKDPIVYIYNSHQTENYTLRVANDYSISPTVYHASYILKEHLKNNGVSSLVEDSSVKKYLSKNKLSYYYCYDATRSFIKERKKKYNFKYIIDLHRDSVGYKKTTCEINNKKYAKIMFVVSIKHKNHEKNLSFVRDIYKRLNKEYNGITRGIYERKDVIFNQDLYDNSILIEVGGVDNTIDEINNTLEVFAKVLSSYIKEKGD